MLGLSIKIFFIASYRKLYFYIAIYKEEKGNYTMEVFDDTDLLLLKVLSENSNFTIKKLAAKVNLTPSPVFERIKRLEDQG